MRLTPHWLFVVRYVAVAASLIVPLVERVYFAPYIILHTWVLNFFVYQDLTIGPSSTAYLIFTIASLLMVPAAVALWFRLGDAMRDEAEKLSKPGLCAMHMILAWVSFEVLSLALMLSDSSEYGPIWAWAGYWVGGGARGDILFRLTAALVAIELITYCASVLLKARLTLR